MKRIHITIDEKLYELIEELTPINMTMSEHLRGLITTGIYHLKGELENMEKKKKRKGGKHGENIRVSKDEN